MFQDKNAEVVSQFLRTDFSDAALYRLYEAAKEGNVGWYTVGCLVGRSDMVTTSDICGSRPAKAYYNLGRGLFSRLVNELNTDKQRHRALIPLIEKEIARRTEGKKLTEQLYRAEYSHKEVSEEEEGEVYESE